MNNILIINAHHRVEGVAEGSLNAAYANKAKELLEARGYTVRTSKTDDGYDIAEELEKHQWADAVILQSPVYWMGVPWTFKKYMDEVYSSGLQGELCNNDGRSRSHPKGPKANYGGGGTLQDTKYMISLTFNAPKEAFNDPEEYLFQGKSVDDLFFPQHMNFRFFGMTALPTFSCHDIIKDPKADEDFARFEAHLETHFPVVDKTQAA